MQKVNGCNEYTVVDAEVVATAAATRKVTEAVVATAAAAAAKSFLNVAVFSAL